jgi:hypothetical protein
MSKTIDTLVPDIYNVFTENHPKVLLEEDLKKMGEQVANAVKRSIEEVREPFRLRPSNLGTPDRQLYFQSRDPQFNDISAKQRIRFLLGHILEPVLIYLVKESGHDVTEEQLRREKGGIFGSQDCRIDDNMVDVKTSSSYGFSKFEKNKVVAEDAWGYPHQIDFYRRPEDRFVYWLAIDKQHGTLALARESMMKLPNAEARIEELKEVIAGDDVPEPCYPPEEPLANGNVPLPKPCSWCKYKGKCYESLRSFKYSNGVQHFSHIEKAPRVEEVTYGR